MVLSFWSRPGWRRRSLIVFAVCLVAGHAAAATGLALGMPEAPYGDEGRFYALLANETLRIVWLPWEELGADARSPAGWARAVLPVVALWLSPDSALACRTAELALERGLARIALVLGEAPHQLLQRLPDDAIRARVRNLLRVADKIVSVVAGARDVTAEVRARGQFELALSIDGEGLQESPTTLGIDASGRVLCRPDTIS